MMQDNHHIATPTLCIDEARCKANIRIMAEKADAHGLAFRPHFKTHQSLEIGRWFKACGIQQITVSSLTMAGYFASEWNDITVAFPVNVLEIDTINKLAERITLNLLVESVETMDFLVRDLHFPAGIFLKIDVGYHRTGIDPADTGRIDAILHIAENCPRTVFKGFLGHAGHTYRCRGKEEVEAVHRQSLAHMALLKARYSVRYPGLTVSLGDTPSCSLADDFEGVDEIRPGNFVFYDLMQHRIGSNTIDQIAVALACPIVAVHKERAELVVYGGAVHLSKDMLSGEQEGIVFGRVAEPTPQGWGGPVPGMYVKSLSQEHGIIALPPERTDQYAVGDIVYVLPVHSCLTADLMKGYRTGDGRAISMMPPPGIASLGTYTPEK